MSRPFSPRQPFSSQPFVRVNGKIRAREVRLIGQDGGQLGILQLGEALTMARAQQVDLVEIAPNAVPPVCRLVDYGKFRYEQAKKEKESRKHQHANKVKELQLSASIDPHDFGVKLGHAIDFLCEDMKVKVSLRFRGREMAHQEFGMSVIKKFITEVEPYGHPDAPAKIIGKGVHVMISPLPRNKRAKHPDAANRPPVVDHEDDENESEGDSPAEARPKPAAKTSKKREADPGEKDGESFANNPFSKLDVPVVNE